MADNGHVHHEKPKRPGEDSHASHGGHGGHIPEPGGEMQAYASDYEHPVKEAHPMSHGEHAGAHSAENFLRRFVYVSILLVPMILLTPGVRNFFGIGEIPYDQYIMFALATGVFYFSLIFFQHAIPEIRTRRFGMMTLVSVAVAAGYLFSAAATFIPALEEMFYLEISTLIWILLLGHYLEARSSAAAGSALSEVAKLLPKKARRIEDGEELEVDIADLREGDRVRVRPGEKVPSDGIIGEGSSGMDESHISGESLPVSKGPGDTVIAGSIALDGSLLVELNRVGENSTIGQIEKLIAQAQLTKPAAQRLADRAAGVLTLVALGIAFLTVVIWTGFGGAPFVFGLTLGITVLVIACPHALGLAIPTVTTIATSLAVRNGLFIKDMSSIETVRNVDYIVFDKTGTLTEGSFGVREIADLRGDSVRRTSVDDFSETDFELLKLAASLEQSSSHPIGAAIVEKARERYRDLPGVDDFRNIAGRGVTGSFGGKRYHAGNAGFMREEGILDEVSERVMEEVSQAGMTSILLAEEGKIIAVIGLADIIRKESGETVSDLHSMGYRVAMLTGDNEEVARSVAESLHIDTYFAGVLPEEKFKKIEELQKEGNRVMMVGDGVNDAPALIQADAGIAVGAGTDIAVEAGDIVLMRNNPKDIVTLVSLSKKVRRKMVENLFWALGYNVVALPAAAGLFAPWGIFLSPQLGAVFMTGSTFLVVINALTLRSFGGRSSRSQMSDV